MNPTVPKYKTVNKSAYHYQVLSLLRLITDTSHKQQQKKVIVEIAKLPRPTNGQFVRWGKGWSRGYTTEIVQTSQTLFMKYI